ncbi:Tetratricopeptide TPR_2 repeat-containing protein [Gemmatirosa kalamazoonensis]|uniref:Tetratricopeptide TPR_2 repeat-containing protein n=1 Tax=Gemmatirosa kalamazoonensis TaxID=861299 RepID=W0RCX8_9BACT|nr:tetratricopeptide repeat protein [Gemmatirosa kalamazoonensis]AHG88656.1 Tetratricopeptide TPR_2 repeat-containing protein [Gemmatirosa kalamazoonensis]
MSMTTAPSPVYAPSLEEICARDVHEALACGRRFESGGDVARALRAYGVALSLADTPALRAEAVRRVGDAHRAREAWDDARAAYDESLAIARAHALAELEAEALNAAATVAILRGDALGAEPLFRRALACRPGPRVRGLALTNLGLCAARVGDHARAVELFAASLDCYREAGYERGVLMAINNVAAAHIETGEPEAALPLLREAAHIARDLVELDLLLLTARNEAEACLKLGRLDEAESRIGIALGHFSSAGAESRRAECLVILGDVLRAHRMPQQDDAATRCYERAAEIAESAGAAHVAARARASLGAAA